MGIGIRLRQSQTNISQGRFGGLDGTGQQHRIVSCPKWNNGLRSQILSLRSTGLEDCEYKISNGRDGPKTLSYPLHFSWRKFNRTGNALAAMMEKDVSGVTRISIEAE
jgi:hypothetical protein